MAIKFRIVAFFATLFFVFLLFAFSLWQINPANWSFSARSNCVLMAFPAALMAATFPFYDFGMTK